MNHRNDSSQVTACFNDQTPDLNSGISSKRTDSKTDQSSKEVDSKRHLEAANGKGSASKVSDLKVEGLKIADPNGADHKSNAMGSYEGRLASSNGAASPETSSNGAPPQQHSVKRKHSQTSYGEAAGGGPPPDTGEKLKREPECHMEPDDLHPNQNHTVLIDTIKFRDNLFVPYKGQPHVWDNQHVKLPPSFPKNGPESRWEATVNALNSLTKGKARARDVELAIMSYNHSYKREWNFSALHSYVQQLHNREDNMSTLISKMAKLAMQLPNYIQHAIPLLKQNHNHAITLSQDQISCLLANAFFCTFPHRNSTKPNSEYANFPTINFSSLFCEPSARKTQKLRSLFHYFNTITNKETRPEGLVTFERICISQDKLPNWKKQTEMLTHLHVYSKGTIEREGKGLLQVDFAAKYIGGGVLGRGLVQEEIRFLMCPELIVARLFTEKLGDNECLKITGAQTYSVSSGYSDTFKWLGPHIDDTKRDKWKRRMCQIVAIDALHFRNPKDQYTKENVQRELNKAYVGFKQDPSVHPDFTPDIATGNWGCGAFNGDPELKALIQMMAAAVAGRSLAFFTFGNRVQAQELRQIHDLLKTKRVSVGRLYTLLVRYCEENQHYKSKSVFNYIREKNGSTPSQL